MKTKKIVLENNAMLAKICEKLGVTEEEITAFTVNPDKPKPKG